MRTLRENLFVQFTIVAFVVIAILAATISILLSNAIRSRAIKAVIDEAVGDASGRLLTAITPGDLEAPMTGERYSKFDAFVRNSVVSQRTARIRVWAKDGTVIYSNETADLGQRFPNNENVLKAMKGANAAEIPSIEDLQKEGEDFSNPVIEVYTPIIFEGNAAPSGVFEIYQYYLPTQLLIGDQRRAVFLSAAIGFVLLYGTLVGSVWRGWRMIVRQKDELKKSEERYRALVELGGRVGEAIIMLQDNGHGEGMHIFVSNEWPRITGYSREELLNLSFFNLLHPEYRGPSLERHRRKVSGESLPELFEMVVIRKDGSEVPIEITSAYTTFQGKQANVAFIRDITERRKMEQQLLTTDRLASIGELASGIAHEINNPLTSIIGFSQMLAENKEVPDSAKEDLQIINKEAQRTAGIVRNLLGFARKHALEKQLVNINEIAGTVLSLRAYQQKVSNIHINAQLAPDLPEVMADNFQLQQVFMNIVINAEFFMTETHGKGILTITTERIKDMVRISFADDGPGIAEENLGHIFDPFFTTKEVGKGTGLGLSICHGIITEHGGRIYAESQPGKGAAFIIELPIGRQ